MTSTTAPSPSTPSTSSPRSSAGSRAELVEASGALSPRSSSSRTARPSPAPRSAPWGRRSARRCSPPAMSGYQETLTDPSYHRQVVVATAPHIGNTGWNDEDDESSRIWVAGYVVRDAARVSSQLARPAAASTTSSPRRASSACATSTPAPSPATCASAGRCGSAISSVETDPAALLARVRTAPEMSGAHLADEVSTPEAYVVPAQGPHERGALPRRRGRPRHQVDDAVPAGRARHRDPRAARHHDLAPGRGAASPTASSSPTAPATPGRPRTWSRCCARCSTRACPYFGICFGNQLFGRALGFGTYKLGYGHRGINQPVMDLSTRRVEITAHNHGFAVDAPLDGPHRARRTAGRGQPRRAQRRRRRGPRARGRRRGAAVLLRAVPPRGRRRPARRRLPVRPLRRADVRPLEDPPTRQGNGRLMPRRTDISSILVIGVRARSSSARPASSTTPAPRPAACCARRASGSSWSTPTRRRS